MTIAYLVAFLSGLLLAVGVMLFGIERRSPLGAPKAEGKLHWAVPLVGAMAIGSGLVGYLMSRVAPPAIALIAALAAGVLAIVLARWIVAKSAAMVPEHDIDDERYVLQGHIAQVVTPISAAKEGEIAFEIGVSRRRLRARSLDDAPVAAGAEVVIERIEGDVAYVEPWLHVERRL